MHSIFKKLWFSVWMSFHKKSEILFRNKNKKTVHVFVSDFKMAFIILSHASSLS